MEIYTYSEKESEDIINGIIPRCNKCKETLNITRGIKYIYECSKCEMLNVIPMEFITKDIANILSIPNRKETKRNKLIPWDRISSELQDRLYKVYGHYEGYKIYKTLCTIAKYSFNLESARYLEEKDVVSALKLVTDITDKMFELNQRESDNDWIYGENENYEKR